MDIAIQLIIGCICAVIAAVIASSKGRNVVGWFFGGFFLGIIGIIIVAVLPNKKQEAAVRAQAESERRRLREQLRQERLKNEAFRQYTAARLDAHDNQLGVDTRSQQALPGVRENADALRQLAGDASAAPASAVSPMANPSAAVWYYEETGQQKGPVSAMDIRELIRVQKLGGHSLVWTSGMMDWAPVREIDGFRQMVI